MLYLLFLSVISFSQIVVIGTLDFSSPVVPFYALFVVVWCVLMTEHWLRVESTYAMVWGVSNFEKNETDRPAFRGEKKKSSVDGREVIFFPRKEALELLMKVSCAIDLN